MKIFILLKATLLD